MYQNQPDPIRTASSASRCCSPTFWAGCFLPQMLLQLQSIWLISFIYVQCSVNLFHHFENFNMIKRAILMPFNECQICDLDGRHCLNSLEYLNSPATWPLSLYLTTSIRAYHPQFQGWWEAVMRSRHYLAEPPQQCFLAAMFRRKVWFLSLGHSKMHYMETLKI